MRFYEEIANGYIETIGTGVGGIEITEHEYNNILTIIRTPRPEAPAGKAWALRADTLEYELVDAPEPEETEIV